MGATGQSMVAGDPVNTAARVQSVADPGAVLVDHGTWQIAGHAIAFTATGEHALKGKDVPVPLWRADRVLSGVGGSQRVGRVGGAVCGAPGRAAAGQGAVSRQRGAPHTAAGLGDRAAGVGKLRLGWEFEKYIDGLAETVRWHRGRCLSLGDGVAFAALAEMVRQRLGIAEEDSPSPETRCGWRCPS